jgi:hypothetical protein
VIPLLLRLWFRLTLRGRRLAFQSDADVVAKSIRLLLLLLSKYSQSDDSVLEEEEEYMMALFRLELLQRLLDAAVFLRRLR